MGAAFPEARSGSMEVIKKISYIFDGRQKFRSVMLCIGLFIGALLELAGVSLIAELVSLISDPESIHTNRLLSRLYDMTGAGSDRQFFLYAVIALIIIYILKNAYLMIMCSIQYTFIYNNQLKLSSRLIDCYLKKPYTYHLDKNSAEMIRSIMLDSERFFQLLLTAFSVFAEILVSALMCIYLLVVDWMITLSVVVILGAVSGLYLLIFHGRSRKNGEISQYNDGKMHQAINQALGAVKDIKILHREKYFVEAFRKRGAAKYHAVRNNEILGQAPKYLIETVCIGAILAVLCVKLYMGQDLSDMIPQLAAFAMAAFKLLPSVGKIDNYLNLIIFLRPSVDFIYRDIKDTEDMNGYVFKDADADTASYPESESAIRIEGVSYRYPNTDRDVLTDVNFTIPTGKSIGLVGASGAGKSTIADIILGILTPTAGAVMYGDMNVHEHPIKWSKRLAYIPQAIFLADETIRSNVAFGIDEDKIEEDKVWQALAEAQLDEYVRSLPEGLDTMVGERGVRLSGGQRQRIGIARALYGDPEILVLDEATSALDSETETAVMDAIDRLQGRKTLIIIAHRLTTIKGCEKVFKVADGKITDYTEEFRKENA
ncbi:MAG: ABC transporter ATP-binding protein/permease [Lachnospiraceae bacterium]|nr:ABC transporter ATP-binding protein/permease [Lachnospiraceae bacterium]